MPVVQVDQHCYIQPAFLSPQGADISNPSSVRIGSLKTLNPLVDYLPGFYSLMRYAAANLHDSTIYVFEN